MAVVDRDGMRGILQGTIERWLAPDFRAASPDTVSRVEAMILGTSVRGYKGCVEALKRLDYLGALGGMQVPTLYVVGSEDQGAPSDVMCRMAEATPGARLVVPGGAHLPNLDRSAEFNAMVAEFLRLQHGPAA